MCGPIVACLVAFCAAGSGLVREVRFTFLPNGSRNADNTISWFWVDRVDRKVRGQSAAPRSLPSAAHMAKVATKFPGAIGYLRRSS